MRRRTKNLVRIRTGSRLHLGLLSLPGSDAEPRAFGGLGAMIEEPETLVVATPAAEWTAVGPSRERALDVARRAAADAEDSAWTIDVARTPRTHVGLGSGTQLAMAVATAIRRSLGREIDPVAIAAEVGRGLRSAIGVHGFASGGFLVDGGKGPHTAVAPLVARHDVPDEWGILLAIPVESVGLAGTAERDAFARLAERPPASETDALCRLALLGVLPALVERDLPSFGEAVFEFNRRSGLLFQSAQCGAYGPSSAPLLDELRREGIKGVGQSSWGPTVFAIDDPERLRAALETLRRRHSEEKLNLILTSPRNRGWDERTDVGRAE